MSVKPTHPRYEEIMSLVDDLSNMLEHWAFGVQEWEKAKDAYFDNLDNNITLHDLNQHDTDLKAVENDIRDLLGNLQEQFKF